MAVEDEEGIDGHDRPREPRQDKWRSTEQGASLHVRYEENLQQGRLLRMSIRFSHAKAVAPFGSHNCGWAAFRLVEANSRSR